MQVRAASESGAGHIRVVPEEWPKTRENTLRLTEWEQALAAVEAVPGVTSIARRARANGLLAFGNRMMGVEMVGVDPAAEPAANRLVGKARLTGRYLEPGDRGAVVIGTTLAERLDVELDDDLMVTLSGSDGIAGAMLTIVGLLDTGSRELNTGMCHVTLEDLNGITEYDAPGEISILLDDYRRIDAVQKELQEVMPPGNTVVSWRTITPALAANVEGDTAFIRFMSFIIVVVVILGIASAQLTAFLERRKEFGVLSALGMKARHVVGLILIEAIAIGLAGSVATLALGGPVAYLVATKGIHIAGFMGGDLGIDNVLLDPYIYGDFGVWLVWYAVAVSVTASLVASIYPMWFAIRTNPVEALRGK